MPRRPSTPEDGAVPASYINGHGHGHGKEHRYAYEGSRHRSRESFTSAKHDDIRHSDSLDRRKPDRWTVASPWHSPTGSAPLTPTSPGNSKPELALPTQQTSRQRLESPKERKRWRPRSPWVMSVLMLGALSLAIILVGSIVHAFWTRQLDVKGCDMCWSRPVYIKFADFDTEHTRFASKYNLYMIREGGFDEDPKVKGIPVLFIPGNAGSYKQARCLEAETAKHFHAAVEQGVDMAAEGKASLDFFTVDFNEDFSAFHGQTLLDQAEYVNDAVSYILSLYHDPRRAQRDSQLPDPTAVVLIGHSMGGVVARAMLTMPNYQSNSVTTIITMSAPHARPPVSVDSKLVQVYDKINNYWQKSYQQRWASDNPLWHVTLISIAGGGLDTVVPSDFASVESLMPLSHGLTVFTSGIPHVWSGCDHIQTTWCAQLMRVIAESVYGIIDVRRPTQTLPRAIRMRNLKKSFLTGLESEAAETPSLGDYSLAMSLYRDSNIIMAKDERLVLRRLGERNGPVSYLMPIPRQNISIGSHGVSVLTNEVLNAENANLAIHLCAITEGAIGDDEDEKAREQHNDTLKLSPQVSCKEATADAIRLPASTPQVSNAFDSHTPFTFLHFSAHALQDLDYLAITDKCSEPHQGWIIAETTIEGSGIIETDLGLLQLLTSGLSLRFPVHRPLVNEIQIPALHSSLLAFNLHLSPQGCSGDAETFTPLLRQHLEQPFESKYVVNAESANISLHGIAPYMPPPLNARTSPRGVALQIWSDPTCNSSMDISLQLDIPGSMGKLVMRYRLMFAAFPLLVVALVLRKQFQIYNKSGIFIVFADAMTICLQSSIPISILILSAIAMTITTSGGIAASSSPASESAHMINEMGGNLTESFLRIPTHDLLLGSQDPLFCFLIPLFGLISVGACIIVNYLILALTQILSVPYNYLVIHPPWTWTEDRRTKAPTFATSSPRRRFFTTCVLLILVATIIPYQFAFLDAVLVQLFTCIRASGLVGTFNSLPHHNFYNYAHSILVLMFWVLPINLPVLVVWIHNLAVHWLTPFSSHHNIISIMPYLLLVETLTFGRMIPRCRHNLPRRITSLAFLILAFVAAIYGVSHAYMLHHIVNAICALLVMIHIWGTGGVDLNAWRQILIEGDADADALEEDKKQP